jgi:hypothetical protein
MEAVGLGVARVILVIAFGSLPAAAPGNGGTAEHSGEVRRRRTIAACPPTPA